MSTPPFPNLDELLQRLLDGQLEPEEMQRLQQAILEDPGVRDYYVDSLLVSAVIRRSSQATGELSKSDLVQALSGGTGQGDSQHPGGRFYARAALLVLGVLALAAFCLFGHKTSGPPLGTLTGAYEAQWRGSHPRPGESLYAGPYELREGVAQMELGQGTSLVLEAPGAIEIKSVGEVMLRKGRLAAVVPPPARGFRVCTRTALITDLGTEVGVVVRSDGRTEAHVLKGRVSVALNSGAAGQTTSRIVNEHLAVMVDADGQAIRGGLTARADLFLLQVPSASLPSNSTERLNLADLVGGGNGRGTGTFERGIDLGTGQAVTYPVTTIQQTRRNEFHPTPQFPGVDGVFVPNGAWGPPVISSTGLLFSPCPETVGSYYSGPTNSGRFYDLPSRQTYTARLNGVGFGTPAHPALNLHPNAGITFDLDRIRRDHPNVPIDRFTAVCGIPKDAPQAQFSSADVWVLLDGVVRLHLRYPVARHVVEKVDVPVPARTRFLTLVTTCSGRADYSWILFGDPFLAPAAAIPAEAAH